jgi:hypothetical protein
MVSARAVDVLFVVSFVYCCCHTHRSIKGESQRSRVKGAWGTAINCDMLLFLVDAHRQV